MIGELVEVVTVNTHSFEYYYLGKSENFFGQYFTQLCIQNHCIYVNILDQEKYIGFKTMIKRVFEDGNIQDHISEKNASDFFSESCFGIVFPEIESLKSYQDRLNGYDFSEIPLNYHGPFQDLEDNGMRTFPLESSANFVTGTEP